MKLPKITCPHCGKVVCVGDVEGTLKCKHCGNVFHESYKLTNKELENEIVKIMARVSSL